MTRCGGATDDEAIATVTHRAWIIQGLAIPMLRRPDAAERCGSAADKAMRLGENRKLWDLTR
jgi:hypothetical protein